MTRKQKRLSLILGGLAVLGLAAGLVLFALSDTITFFHTPSDLADTHVQVGQRIRLGGMVEQGSVRKTPGTLDIAFLVTDFKHTIPVRFSGILPDLFREGQGVVAHGRMQGDTFMADEILAKHDEKYMPPEVAESLKNNPPPPNVPAPASGST